MSEVNSSVAPVPWLHHPDSPETGSRLAVVAAVTLVHLAAGWGLLQIESVRQTVAVVAPMMVNLITEAPEPPPAAPPPPPPPQPLRLKTPPPPKPLIAAQPRPQPEPEAPVFIAPPALPEPVAEQVVAEEAPPAPPAPPSPSPKLISASEIVCPTPASPQYPPLSEQLGEQGTSMVRVLIDAQGRPQDVALHRSSGHLRLDRAALAGVRSLRCKPYLEAGVAQAVWVLAPIDFQLQ